MAIKFNHYEIVEVVKIIGTISRHAVLCINSACICIPIILTLAAPSLLLANYKVKHQIRDLKSVSSR